MRPVLELFVGGGAHIGVQRSIQQGYMSRCEMVWSTAGVLRTCSRCLELKDKVIGYTDDSGVTLPPLHPRCRCSIIYKEVGDKEQRKPHLIINRYEDNLTRYNLFEFTNKAKVMLPTIEKYSGRKSKWVGQIMLNANGGSSKPWECYILLDEKAPVHALIHELIHSCSVSHYGARIFAANRWEEELTVHYLSQELALLKKFPVVDSGYDEGVALIREFKMMSGVNMTDLEFASELIKQPLGERWNWLWEQISAKMKTGADLETGTRLMSKLEAIKRWIPKEPPE